MRSGFISTPLALNLHYNNRLQLVDLRLGLNSAGEWDWSRGALTFYYGTAAVNAVNPFKNSTDINGNVLRQMNYVPLSAGGYVMPQIDDYQHDPLSRIQQVSESQQSSAGQVSFLFTQKYAYDRWGNRTIDVLGTTPSIPEVTRKTFVVDAATNRLTSSDGCAMTYDAAGNQTYDCVGTHYYDAENRMTKAVQGSSNNYYFYDGNGKRVRRILNGSQTWGGQETWFVYGFEGELAAEYAYNQVTAPLASAPQKEYGYRGGKLLVVWDGTQAGDDQLKWLVTDHLGSTRMEANKSGSLTGIRRHDYLPFGEELVASTGAQRGQLVNVYEPPASSVRQRFTGKERDVETGFDWFGPGRYYTSSQGRFVSLDPGGAGIKRSNPQTWNHYTYTLNRPTIAVDPDGLSTIVVTVTNPANGGNPTATILFSGRIIQNGGEGAVLYNGLAAGQGRNRMVEYNDTPYGGYRFDGTEGGNADSRLGRGYGTGKINLTGLAGEIIDSGRTLIRLHGGGSALGDRAYDLNQELRPTLGCVRMHNGNVNALISLIGIAAANQDPLDRVFIGDEDTLNTMANRRDRNGNYVNPDLRLALGMWNNDQEYQDLLTADANRRAEIQRQREEERERQEQERRMRRRRQRGNL